MESAPPPRPRITVDGKFFRLGEKKFFIKGVSYGPFAPNGAGQLFASPEQTASDLAGMKALGANLLRVYHVPAKWFLDLAEQAELKVLVDIPWNKQLCFLESYGQKQSARETVSRVVASCARHPAVLGFSVANEIAPDIVRWSGARAVAEFIDDLIQAAKRVDPECLCTFTNFPPTEFLRVQSLDFVCFNVYLHQEQPFRNYLARIHMQAQSKPVVLGEFGVDSLREGEERKSEMLEWQIREMFRSGLAGGVLFSYTDDWWKDGRHVESWHFGLTTADRKQKASFAAVQKVFAAAPRFPPPREPKVSVVVASYNGDRTLKACLDSLSRLNYPKYEVILVDDGSTDSTQELVRSYRDVRCIQHDRNLGLAVARNTGIAAASGEIIAFLDADCRADEDWLFYLVSELQRGDWAGIGGPNLLPPDDSPLAAAVMVSPGGPAHVMLTDRQAEHIPGCNMAFYRWVLDEVGGFDPIFRKAGDDVDVCWRLQQAGHKIGFSPAAFVWHYRRSTPGAYFAQQYGYGEAEALLVGKHPECFSTFGGSIWRGRIYTASKFGVLVRKPIIYRGLFGSAGFQFLYASQPAFTLMLFTTLEYHLLVTVPLWVLSASVRQLLPLAIASLLTPIGVCVAAGVQAALPRKQTRWWSRPMVAALFFLQPVVRGWARYQGRLDQSPTPPAAKESLDSIALRQGALSLGETQYWAEKPISRLNWIADIVRRLEQQGWPVKSDVGWSEFDVEVYGSLWSRVLLTSVAEEHPPDRQLLRCRLRARWSLQAIMSFWLLCALILLALGFFQKSLRWWSTLLLLVPVPLAVWFLRRQQRDLQSRLIVFLDSVAKEWNLTRIRPGPK